MQKREKVHTVLPRSLNLLPTLHQHRLAIACSGQDIAECGLFAQIFQQGVIQQSIMGTVILLHGGF